MGKTFQAAQLKHERFLTIDHSCKIFLISAKLNFHRPLVCSTIHNIQHTLGCRNLKTFQMQRRQENYWIMKLRADNRSLKNKISFFVNPFKAKVLLNAMQQIELTLVLLQQHRSQLTQPRTTLFKAAQFGASHPPRRTLGCRILKTSRMQQFFYLTNM